MEIKPTMIEGAEYSEDGERLLKFPKNYPAKYLILSTDAKIIEEYAFSGMKDLVAIYITEGVEAIRANAFCDCTALRAIYLPKSCTDFRGYVFGKDFYSRDLVIYTANDEERSRNFCPEWNAYATYSAGRPPYCDMEQFDRYHPYVAGSDGHEVLELIEVLKEEEKFTV